MKQDVINKVVKASGVCEGDLVLVHFWGEDCYKSIANDFTIAVASLGATPVFLQESRSLNRRIFANTTESSYKESYFQMLENVDVVLDIFTYQPVTLGEEIESAKLELYRNYIAKLFEVLMKAKKFVQIRIPTKENAEESCMEVTEYIHRMEEAYDIDYNMLKSSCEKAKEDIEKYHKIMLLSGKECKLNFNLTGRSWHIDAGDGDWPCGEIYIAPNERDTNGSVYFERLFIEDVGEYEGVTIDIENGQLLHSDNKEVNLFFDSLSLENKVICELGFGMNTNVKELCGYSVLDEKMANSFHIAIGANNMFGGNNAASIHMDFVGTGYFEIQKME